MGKVYVTQEMSKLNYLPAEKFGEIIFLAKDDFSPVVGSLTNGRLVESIKTKLKGFDPKNDFIVFSGSPTVAAAVFAFVGGMHRAFRVLRWSNRDNLYTPIAINLS